MKKKLMAIALAATFAFGALAFAAAEPKEKKGSWKGEVVDLACYLAHGKKGPSHASCAKACAKGGQPMGLLGDDGKVFLLAADHADEKPFKQVMDFAGSKVEIHGTAVDSSGITMITVESVAALK